MRIAENFARIYLKKFSLQNFSRCAKIVPKKYCMARGGTPPDFKNKKVCYDGISKKIAAAGNAGAVRARAPFGVGQRAV
ncbi:MAG: hypothetical protein J6P03_03940 [Opitutales bacterium]|nr:hypothetical protein [Opitutales bacterium]